jgi:type I restriction enzyme S subunit
MKKYDNYKDSGIEWIGEIPNHWDVTRIKYKYQIGRGRVISNEDLVEDAIYPVYSSQTLNNGCLGYIDTFDFDDKLITWTTDGANAGTVFLREGKFNCTNVCGTLKAKSIDVIPEFDFYYLQYATQFYKRPDTNGAKIMNNEMAVILSLKLSAEEQTSIANYLDHKTTKIDHLIAKKEQFIQLLKEERVAVINQAITKGIDLKVQMKDTGIEWLGKIPEHWEVMKLKFITKIFRGKFSHRPRNDERLYNGIYPFFQTGDVAKADKILTNYSQTLNELGLNVSTLFTKGTIVMTIAANIGDVAILGIDGCFPDSIVGFEPNDRIQKDYLFHLLKNMKDEFINSAIKNTQLNLNIERISTSIIALPPLKEQLEISNYIDVRTTDIINIINKTQHEIELLKEYKTALISEVVTGKVDVRNEKLN